MDIYSETILEYFKNPPNKGQLIKATTKASEDNPLCGDKISIFLQIDNKGKITNATFDGEGCAISQASASMLTESIIGKSAKTIKKIKNEKIYEMLGIEISPARIKCALLGLTTMKKAIIIYETKQNAKK